MLGKRKQVNTNEKQVKVEKKEELTTSTVKIFDCVLYKKDLGENRNRYEPLVTSAMYNELVNVENSLLIKRIKAM